MTKEINHATPGAIEENVASHYGKNDLAQTILDSLATNGISPERLQPDDLIPFEELHIGGREATEYLVAKLDLEPEHRVLDVGCGIGGAVRYIANHVGCQVTGIDITAEFIQTAITLTKLVGLEANARFKVGSALSLPYEDNHFDAVVTLHAAMNIAERPLLYREMARVLKPGGKMALYDVMKQQEGELRFPVPWADTPNISYLLTADETAELLQEAGLTVLQVDDRSAIVPGFFRKLLSESPNKNSPAPPGVIMTDSHIKLRNTLANIEDGLIAPVLMLVEKLPH